MVMENGEGANEQLKNSSSSSSSSSHHHNDYRNNTNNNNMTMDDQRIVNEYWKFARLISRIQSHYEWMSTVLLSLGVIGGLIAIATIIHSPRMKTPSLLYHKALLVNNMIFCTNNIVLKLVDYSLTVSSVQHHYLFQSYGAAFYSGKLSRVITSTCGYIVLYLTLSIALDRCLALCFPFRYQTYFNKKEIGRNIIVSALVLSVSLNSWSAWFERQIFVIQSSPSALTSLNTEDSSYSMNISTGQTTATTTTTLYYWKKIRSPMIPNTFFTAKNIYNVIIRFAYPIALSIFTGIACWKFSAQQRKKYTLKNHYHHPTGNNNNNNNHPGFNNNSSSYNNKKSIARSRESEKRLRSLFLLMISVVILAYIQVLPRETKRILELIAPKLSLWDSIEDSKRSLTERRESLGLMKGHQSVEVSMNIATVLERSLTFYVYFGLNAVFRREAIRTILLPIRNQCLRYTSHPLLVENSIFISTTTNNPNNKNHHQGGGHTPLTKDNSVSSNNHHLLNPSHSQLFLKSGGPATRSTQLTHHHSYNSHLQNSKGFLSPSSSLILSPSSSDSHHRLSSLRSAIFRSTHSPIRSKSQENKNRSSPSPTTTQQRRGGGNLQLIRVSSAADRLLCGDPVSSVVVSPHHQPASPLTLTKSSSSSSKNNNNATLALAMSHSFNITIDIDYADDAQDAHYL